MTSNQHGPYIRGDTRVTMAWTKGSHLATGSESPNHVSVRIGVCNRLREAGSLVSRISHGAVNTFPGLYTPPVKPWEPGVPEVRNREDRPRVKLVTGAKS